MGSLIQFPGVRIQDGPEKQPSSVSINYGHVKMLGKITEECTRYYFVDNTYVDLAISYTTAAQAMATWMSRTK